MTTPAPIRLGPRKAAAGAIGLVGVAVVAACAAPGYGNYNPNAGRPATPSEARAITTAVRTSPLTAGAGNRPYQVIAIRISTRTAGYAFATINPLTTQLDGAAVALRLFPTRSGPVWTVTQVGSAHVGCSAPAAVRTEFGVRC